MDSIKINVPRNLVKEFHDHPEEYGDFIVTLINGMTTDVYVDESNELYTITNDEELIKYLDITLLKQQSKSYNFDKYEHYCLHDSVISSINIINNQLIVLFKEGYYETDEDGVMTNELRDCKLIYTFDIENNEEIDFSIVQFYNYKNKYKSMTFNKFSKLINQNNFEVNFEYRLDFLKSIVLTGNIANKYYEFEFYNVKQMNYIFTE